MDSDTTHMSTMGWRNVSWEIVTDWSKISELDARLSQDISNGDIEITGEPDSNIEGPTGNIP